MPTNSPSDARRPSWPLLIAGGVAFAVVATLNASGYRYGVADQGFYIPAILDHVDPRLFPRDGAMIAAQGKYLLLDELTAALMRATGAPLPWLFLAAQAATLAALYAGGVALARALALSPLATVAWMAALTLRHRIARTGVNTLEGYFHPRVLVCGLGLLSLALFLRGRRWWALALAVTSGLLHPTTAACFVAILAVALVVTEPRMRLPVALSAGVAIVAVGALAWSGRAFDLTVMDADWRTLVATKDYTFPTEWPSDVWAINLLGPAILGAVFMARHRRGLASRAETGVVAGALALVAGFLLSLPPVAAGVALAVQLQTSRVFWPVELLATLFLAWALVDGGSRPASAWRARMVAGVLVVAALIRGAYVGFLETPARPVLAVGLSGGAWTRALRWVRDRTPADAYVLADPGHAWKFGTAVRIGAERDVFLEETKDVAMAMYSRDAARQVLRRIGPAADFAELDEPALRALAAREGLTVLVTERRLDLPVLHVEDAVRIYELRRKE